MIDDNNLENTTQVPLNWEQFESDSTCHESELITRFVSDELTEPANLAELSTPPQEKYKVIKQIDQGGMKEILQVKDRDTMRNIAMAVLASVEDEHDVARFVQEARITANLEHPNIMPIHDIGVDEDGAPYFTMKQVKGETLAQIIRKLRRDQAHYLRKYNQSYLLQIYRKVCDAINFAHAKGIIHLDLKPANILVGEYGEVLVLDWGLAKYVGAEEEEISGAEQKEEDSLLYISRQEALLTVDGEIKGTPGYMAPEQAAGRNQDKSYATDVYALGAILYNILTLQTPIPNHSLEQVFNDTISGDFLPPSRRTPDRVIPEALEAITMKAMATDPNDRYPRVKRILKDLNKYDEGHITSAENASWTKHSLMFLKRRRRDSILVAVVISALLIIAGIAIKNTWQKKAAWGRGEDIMPDTRDQFEEDWIVSQGNWQLRNGRLLAAPGKGSSYRIFYKQPVYGNIALEFTGKVMPSANAKSGDLSIILSGNPYTFDGYYFQVGGVANATAGIQRKGEFASLVSFRLEPGKEYRIRAEKTGEWLKLFCNGRLLLQSRDIFYLEGGYVGLYTFGCDKEFWNIKLYHRGVPQLVSPLHEGDSYYRESRAADGEMRRKLLEMARKAYNRVFESHPEKELGYEALLKKAYVDIELGNITDAQFDCGYLEHHYPRCLQRLLKAELAFINHEFDNAYAVFNKTFNEFPEDAVSINSCLLRLLNSPSAEKMTPKAANSLWRLYVEHLAVPILRCRDKQLQSLEFIRGLQFELIDCSQNQISSLEPLKGMNLKTLDCAQNNISDLSPLAGMKLQELECHQNPITSIEVLKGMPLKTLSLNGCDLLTDLTPLAECHTLERLTIPEHINNIGFLKKLPNLKYLNTKWDAWEKTATQFWQEHDQQQK